MARALPHEPAVVTLSLASHVQGQLQRYRSLTQPQLNSLLHDLDTLAQRAQESTAAVAAAQSVATGTQDPSKALVDSGAPPADLTSAVLPASSAVAPDAGVSSADLPSVVPASAAGAECDIDVGQVLADLRAAALKSSLAQQVWLLQAVADTWLGGSGVTPGVTQTVAIADGRTSVITEVAKGLFRVRRYHKTTLPTS